MKHTMEHKKYHKKCRECNETFSTNLSRQIFCSNLCLRYNVSDRTTKKRAEERRQNPIIYPTEKCLCCNKEFHKKHYNHKYCSSKCATNHWSTLHPHGSSSKSKITHWLKLRFDVLRRDGFACRYCGRSPKDGAKLNVDHIKPKSKGGLCNKGNLITSCFECNQGKKDVLLSKREQEKLKSKNRVL